MKKRIDELAPCGVFCGACPSFNKSCKGCASEDTNQKRKSKFSCKIRMCCYTEKNFDFCIECESFPCNKIYQKLLKTHRSNPLYRYRHEIPSIFAQLKEMGSERYFEFQKGRWKCKACGGTIKFYEYKCDCCGKKQMVV